MTSGGGDLIFSVTWYATDEWNKRPQPDRVRLPWLLELCDGSLGLWSIYGAKVTGPELCMCSHVSLNLAFVSPPQIKHYHTVQWANRSFDFNLLELYFASVQNIVCEFHAQSSGLVSHLSAPAGERVPAVSPRWEIWIFFFSGVNFFPHTIPFTLCLQCSCFHHYFF